MRYLSEPAVDHTLTTADRRALERLCARLPEIIPVMPAVLTHGDLWAGNLVSQPGGRITVIDPAVSCTWAEVDLSMLWGSPRPAAAGRFFALYQELNPSPPGWTGRMPVLHLREKLPVQRHRRIRPRRRQPRQPGPRRTRPFLFPLTVSSALAGRAGRHPGYARGVFDKSHLNQASSARRLAIEAPRPE